MTNLIYFILATSGITQILVYGKIFDNIRPINGWLGKLFSCTMCMGFWAGVFLWSVNTYTTLFSFDYSPLTGFLLGCLSSGTCYIFDMIVGDKGLRIER